MFPFWIDSVWSSLPQLLALVATSVAILVHMATGHH